MRKARLLVVAALVTLVSGCANVMYMQRFRPVDVEIHAPLVPPASVLVWVPEPTSAASIATKLDAGVFQPDQLGKPEEYSVSPDSPIVAVAGGYEVRTCGLRVLGLPRPENPTSRPLLLVVARVSTATTYQIFKLTSGRLISTYQVDVHAEVPEILEVISSHSGSHVKRGRARDRFVMYVSALAVSTPNKRVKLSVRPITGLATAARPAPVRPADYPRRSADKLACRRHGDFFGG